MVRQPDFGHLRPDPQGTSDPHLTLLAGRRPIQSGNQALNPGQLRHSDAIGFARQRAEMPYPARVHVCALMQLEDQGLLGLSICKVEDVLRDSAVLAQETVPLGPLDAQIENHRVGGKVEQAHAVDVVRREDFIFFRGKDDVRRGSPRRER